MAARRLAFDDGGDASLMRTVPVEMPISVEVCGIGYAVMMATPVDLEDYAIGFALSEGLIDSAAQVESVDIHPLDRGVALRIWLPDNRRTQVLDRARRRVNESSCGLCGMDNIDEVLRPLRWLQHALPPTGRQSPARWNRWAIINRRARRLAPHMPRHSATRMAPSCVCERMWGGTTHSTS